MPIAIHDKRSFEKPDGEKVNYEVYGVAAIVEGEYMELRLKNLDAAEKLAFKMIMTGSNPSDIQTSARNATPEESENYSKNNISKTTNILDDDELLPSDKGLFD